MTRVLVRTEADFQVALLQYVEEILAELRKLNSTERTGAVSSATIETNSRGVVVGVKQYAGSVVPVDEALESYARLFREANARAAQQWAQTVGALQP